MQHLVASKIQVVGPTRFDDTLPRPTPRTPCFGEHTLTPELQKIWREFYRDVWAVRMSFPLQAATHQEGRKVRQAAKPVPWPHCGEVSFSYLVRRIVLLLGK